MAFDRKKIIFGALAVFLLVLQVPASADSLFQNHPDGITPDDMSKDLLTFGIDNKTVSRWSISADYGILSYRESGDSDEKGAFYGLRGSYLFSTNRVLLLSELRAAAVGVEYTRDSNSADSDTLDNYLLEARQTFGFIFPFSFEINIVPYAGAGIRYYNDDLSGIKTSDGATVGVAKESQYFYSPFGVSLIIDTDNSWKFTLNVEYDYLWRGKQLNDWKNYYAAYPPGGTQYVNLPKIVTGQDKGKGLRISARITKTGEKLDFYFEPFYNYWSIDDSRTKTFDYGSETYSFRQSKNSTFETGAGFGLRF